MVLSLLLLVMSFGKLLKLLQIYLPNWFSDITMTSKLTMVDQRVQVGGGGVDQGVQVALFHSVGLEDVSALQWKTVTNLLLLFQELDTSYGSGALVVSRARPAA